MGFFSSLAWIIITFLFFTVMVAVISSLKTKEDNLDTAEGYFLASRSLPGVVIAGSLLLTNLSAEQLVGLNGQSWATNMSPIGWEVGSIFTLLILAIAFISLLVGGIGVMNIMLVSVTERTREIGIRMAIGARQSDIMTQFLIEAVTICVAGGIAGVTLSVIAGLTISHIFPSLPVSFSLASLMLMPASNYVKTSSKL